MRFSLRILGTLLLPLLLSTESSANNAMTQKAKPARSVLAAGQRLKAKVPKPQQKLQRTANAEEASSWLAAELGVSVSEASAMLTAPKAGSIATSAEKTPARQAKAIRKAAWRTLAKRYPKLRLRATPQQIADLEMAHPDVARDVLESGVSVEGYLEAAKTNAIPHSLIVGELLAGKSADTIRSEFGEQEDIKWGISNNLGTAEDYQNVTSLGFKPAQYNHFRKVGRIKPEQILSGMRLAHAYAQSGEAILYSIFPHLTQGYSEELLASALEAGMNQMFTYPESADRDFVLDLLPSDPAVGREYIALLKQDRNQFLRRVASENGVGLSQYSKGHVFSNAEFLRIVGWILNDN